jgi:hypothetical protein
MFLILATGALLSQEESVQRSRLLFFALAALPTLLMIGLRWRIGPDWAGYLDIFAYTKLYSFGQAITHADPGFFTLLMLLHLVGASFWVLNLVCGTIFVAGLTAFSLRQPNPWLAFLVAFPYLVIVMGMSGDRQSVALGLLFFALNAFERERLFRAVLLILLAALFHGSVLLIVPFLLLSYARSNFQKAILLVCAAAIGFYFFRVVFSNYASRYGSDRLQSGGVAYRLAMNALSAVIFLVFERRFEFEKHLTRLWRNISLCTLGLVLLLIVVPSSTAIDRFLLYFFPLQFVVLSRVPKVFTAGRNAAGQITMAVIAYAALVQIVFLVFGKFATYYIPYKTIFQQ